MNSPKEHKEFIQPTEMAYARWMHGSIASRHVRQSSIKVGNDQQHRWACLDLAAACFFAIVFEEKISYQLKWLIESCLTDTKLLSLALARTRSKSRLIPVGSFLLCLKSRLLLYVLVCANVVYLLRYSLVCHFHLQQGGSHSGQLASLPSFAEPTRPFCWIQGIDR